MKNTRKPWLRTLLFTLGGAALGGVYYHFVGCSGGSCAIGSSPWASVLYMGLIGFMLSGGFCSACRGGSCNLSDQNNSED